MLRNSLRLFGIVALAALISLPVSASAQPAGGGGPPSDIGPDWGPFQGLDSNGNHIMGRDQSVAVTGDDDIYRDADGNLAPPTWASVFGVDENGVVNEPVTHLESGNTSITDMTGNETEVGILVVDGERLEVKGTSLFVGLIVIRNCGTLRMAGNPNVYGAIIVDAVRRDAAGNMLLRADGTPDFCEASYDPFGGAGTPAVRFSRAPLSGPPGTGTGTGTGVNMGVTIWNEHLDLE